VIELSKNSSWERNTAWEHDATRVRRGFNVWSSGEVLAQQTGADTASPHLLWRHTNPITGDLRETDSLGRVVRETHLDPGGADVGTSDPFAAEDSGGSDISVEASQAAIDRMLATVIAGYGRGLRCKVDGFVTGCRFAVGVVSSGAGVVVGPRTNTSPRVVRYGGRDVLAVFRVFGDGYQGLIPLNARYTGQGRFSLIGAPDHEGLRNGGVALETDFTGLNSTGNDEQFLASSAEPLDQKEPNTQPLSPCVIQVLSKYFPKGVLEKTHIHTGGLPLAVRATEYISGPKGAVTYGADIYFPKDGANAYDTHTQNGIAKIGHEIVQRLQFDALGKVKFDMLYAQAFHDKFDGFNGEEAYRKNPMEAVAFAMQDYIARDLEHDFGQGSNPCTY
jgi:hypothetical protein